MSEETTEIIAQKHCYPEAVTSKPHLDKPEVRLERYPLFEDPAEYLKFRKGKFIYGFFKRWFEKRAIEKSLKGLDDIHSVCDIPCGPGWLFPYWRQKGYKAIGADLSDPMVEAAWKIHKHLNLEGRVIKCNAFALRTYLNRGEADLIASIRFFYYFNKEKRIELLKIMAQVSRKYLLVQYKTTETTRGKKTCKDLLSGKEFCSNQEILEELNAVNLDCMRIVPISRASDRVFVMARNRK